MRERERQEKIQTSRKTPTFAGAGEKGGHQRSSTNSNEKPKQARMQTPQKEKLLGKRKTPNLNTGERSASKKKPPAPKQQVDSKNLLR
mmetsp:Transcript_15074/g.23321  ORF Transcript_15074/g.23321 Transcript_15074/m.23321 type:complete len:88 (-) Transcript_15074:2308-2571(-)